MREILVIAAVVLTTLSTSAGAQSTAAPQDSLAIARRFAEWFFTSQKDSLRAHSSDDLKGQMKSPDEWTTALEQLTGNLHRLSRLLGTACAYPTTRIPTTVPMAAPTTTSLAQCLLL